MLLYSILVCLFSKKLVSFDSTRYIYEWKMHWFFLLSYTRILGESISSGRCKFGRVYLHIDGRVKRFFFRPPMFSSGTCIFRRCIFSLLYFNSIL
jgi:hypothetical protein